MSVRTRILQNPKLKKVLRSGYFFLFDSVLFDGINTRYFQRLWQKHRPALEKTCPLREELPGERILILAPHCDDEIIGCGGAILSYLKRGKAVAIAYLTNGQKQGSSHDAAQVIAERQAEAYQVTAQLGIPRTNIFFLGGMDGDLLNSPIEEKFAQMLQEVQPDTIFLPVPLDNHADHFAVSQKLVNLGFVAGLSEAALFLYESQSPLTLFYSTVCLRITPVLAQKMALLKGFTSQPYPFKFVASLNRCNGSFWGKGESCEAYLETNLERLTQFMKKYFSTDPEGRTRRAALRPNKHSASLISSYESSVHEKAILQELRLDRHPEGQR